MKYLFIVLGMLLLGHGMYLIFGGEFLRSDKVFLIDLFAGIMVYMGFFIVENYKMVPVNHYQVRQKKSMWKNLITVEVLCLFMVGMVIFGL